MPASAAPTKCGINDQPCQHSLLRLKTLEAPLGPGSALERL